MRVVVTSEHHFLRTSDGTIHSSTGGREYRFWQRYLEVFDGVVVVARVGQYEGALPSESVSSGDGVQFLELPNYTGLNEYLRHRGLIFRALEGLSKLEPHACVLRIPGTIGTLVASKHLRAGYPYGAEVVADPYEIFSPGAMHHPLRPFIRRWSERRLRVLCSKAVATAYVTMNALQRRYPPAPGSFTTHFSSVELPDNAFVPAPRNDDRAWSRGRPFTIVTVGSLAQPYKGVDVLLRAAATCVECGLDLRMNVVGDGRYRPQLEDLASSIGIRNRVDFKGQLPPGNAVRQVLDDADLFVLASRTEGLPRAMIEAMARALPCLGTAVGGIPELLDDESLVPPGDAAELAAKIREVSENPSRLVAMSARNLAKAQNYRDLELARRRTEFYRYLRSFTESLR